MHVLLTTCTADKDPTAGLLPAGQRYRGPRVDGATGESSRTGLPLVFLSGVYGLLPADQPIPWYDHALQAHEVEAATAKVVEQLQVRGITQVTAILQPRDTPGWAPYWDVLTEGCRLAGVTLTVRVLG